MREIIDYIINFILENVEYILLAIFIIVALGREYIRIKRIHDSTRKMNLTLGGVFVPRLYRPLTDKEREMLHHKKLSKDEIRIAITIIFYTTIGVFIFLEFLSLAEKIVFSIFVGAGVLSFFLYRNKNKEYADLRSPVLKLVGPLNWGFGVDPNQIASNKEVSFYVGSESFVTSMRTNPKIISALQELDTDELVEIEYTPYSRTVLSLYKFNGPD